MKKNNLVLAALLSAVFLFTGCNNATNSINRAGNYNSNVTNAPNNNSTFDFIGRFFNNWENGKVTDDRYNSYDNSYNNITEPMDENML